MRPANQTELTMARAILEAVKLNQESYDKAAADKAAEESEHIDYSQFYTIKLDEACEKACELFGMTGVGCIIYLALDGWWNDTIEWAKAVIDPTATCVPTSKHCQHGIASNAPSEDIWTCQLCKANYEANEQTC